MSWPSPSKILRFLLNWYVCLSLSYALFPIFPFSSHANHNFFSPQNIHTQTDNCLGYIFSWNYIYSELQLYFNLWPDSLKRFNYRWTLSINGLLNAPSPRKKKESTIHFQFFTIIELCHSWIYFGKGWVQTNTPSVTFCMWREPKLSIYPIYVWTDLTQCHWDIVSLEFLIHPN
jgi:hypothetical protein